MLFFRGIVESTPFWSPRSRLRSMKHQLILSIAACASLASSASAQADFTFQINQGQTNFVWSGTTSLGDITEQPPNFTLGGTTVMTMDTGGNPVGSGGFPGAGDAMIIPNIHGEIPNPLSFLPPLAVIDLTNAHVQVITPSFSVNGSGSFTTDAQLLITQGTLDVAPLTGGSTSTDLSGNLSDPEQFTGTVTWTGSQYKLEASVNSTFAFADAASGVSGSITLTGTLVAYHTPVAPSVYCTSTANSSGNVGTVAIAGSTSIGQSDMLFNANNLPSNTIGIVFYGPSQVSLPFGDGIRCVGGNIARLAPLTTGNLGSISQAINNGILPGTNQLAVGDTQNFQFWFRDVPAGGAGFNTSEAVSVVSMP
ncbi:MAG: hypothetical protein ACI8X5_002843 [Planctomycetota bacterium]|jgi:hypothetical protein